MTYIRMTSGRDRGYVKDFPLPDAQEMLALGQALPVNFDEPDALGFRELPIADRELPTSDCQLPSEDSRPAFQAESQPALKKKKR